MADPAAQDVILFNSDLSILDTVTVGVGRDSADQLTGIWSATNGSTLYVGWRSGGSSTLDRVRVRDGRLLDRVRGIPGVLVTVDVLPDGRTVLLGTTQQTADGQRSFVHFLPADLSAVPPGVRVCDATLRSLATVKTTDKLYALCDDDEIAEVDKKLRSVVRATRIGGNGDSLAACNATALSLAPNGTVLYALCRQSGALLYLDRLRLVPFASADVGDGGITLTRSPGGHAAVVVRSERSEVVVFALRRRSELARARTALPPRAAAVGIDSRTAYVVTSGTPGVPGRILAVDLEDGSIRVAAAIPSGAVGPTAWPSEDSPVMRWTRGGHNTAPALGTP